MRHFLSKYCWLIIIFFFVLVRLVIFPTFWQASLRLGGWVNFYNNAQPARSVLMRLFHDYCDWHPPLYYFFTSLILFIFKSQIFIIFGQIVLAAVSLFIGYKLCRLFFSEKISLLAVFLMAIEPYWAWHNLLLVSENLFTPLILAAFYFFLKYFKENNLKNIVYAAIWFGLAALTRPNTLPLVPILSLALIIIILLKEKLNVFLNFSLKKIIFDVIILNLIFFAILLPWAVRNKIVYNRFTVANILSTNMYFYNLPPLLSLQKNISYTQARDVIVNQAQTDLGDNVGDQGDCNLFTKNEFNNQLTYYKKTARQTILSDFFPYLKIHLVKTTPFFLQSGYFEMWSAYTGDNQKPDLTALVLKGNFNEVGQFFGQFSFKLLIYLGGLVFWGICSLSLIISLFYSYFRDKEKFVFFLFSFLIIIFNALLISPFVLARYRLPLNILFFIPISYLVFEIFKIRRNTEL